MVFEKEYTRAVQKVSSHFEYLENQSRGLDVTWQSVRGILTMHPCTVTLPSRGASQSAVRHRWFSLCTVWPLHSQWPSEHIGFITTMHLPILQLSCRFFFWGGSITSPRSVRPPYSPYLSPCHFWLFPKLKSPLKRRRFVNATLTQYTSSVNSVSLPTD